MDNELTLRIVEEEWRPVRWAPAPAKIGALLESVRAINARDDLPEPNTWQGPPEYPTRHVAMANGIFDIERREMREHTPRYFNTWSLPFDYDPTATCPQWITFLEDVFEGDPKQAGRNDPSPTPGRDRRNTQRGTWRWPRASAISGVAKCASTRHAISTHGACHSTTTRRPPGRNGSPFSRTCSRATRNPFGRSDSSWGTSSRADMTWRRSSRSSDPADRKSVVSGKSVSVRVDLGGRRILKKTNNI